MSDENSEQRQRTFVVIESKTLFHIERGEAERLRSYRAAIKTLPDYRQQLALRAGQAGTRFPFSIRDLDDGLSEAAYFFLGAATYAFESNPGYRYAPIRISARKALMSYGLVPMTTALRDINVKAENSFSLEGIERGSIKFWGNVKTYLEVGADIATIAAIAPAGYYVARDTLYPPFKEIAAVIENYTDGFTAVLNRVGMTIEHDTPATDLSRMQVELRPGHDLTTLPKPRQR